MGPTADGRIKPQVVAPSHYQGLPLLGVSIVFDVDGSPAAGSSPQGFRTAGLSDAGDYTLHAQTSAAAANTSGGRARILQGYRDVFPERDESLPSTLRALLVHTARDLDNGGSPIVPKPYFTPGPDYASGYGAIQVNDAIAHLVTGLIDEHQLLTTTSFRSYLLTVPPGTGLVKLTLAWDDPPAVDGAAKTLINDLDLLVVDPNDVQHFPWRLNPAFPSAPAVRDSPDRTNNLEQVVVDDPAAGAWIVFVRGKHIADGPRRYSLVSNVFRADR